VGLQWLKRVGYGVTAPGNSSERYVVKIYKVNRMIEDINKLISSLVPILEKQNKRTEIDLLRQENTELIETGFDNWNGGIEFYTLFIYVSPQKYALLLDEIDQIENNIYESVKLLLRSLDDCDIEKVKIATNFSIEPTVDISDEKRARLIELLNQQKSLMIAVSTGGPRINDVNEEYKTRKKEIEDLLKECGLKDPNPYDDLWNWYGYWSSSLSHYHERRKYISDLIDPIIDSLKNIKISSDEDITTIEPTGWERVDRVSRTIRENYNNAKSEEDFQHIGLLCRENLITVSIEVYNVEIHEKYCDISPSETDVKRKLDAYFLHNLSGNTYENMRKFARSANALSNELVHKRTANKQMAGMCIAATNAVINIVKLIENEI
jgi:hypothetical protein